MLNPIEINFKLDKTIKRALTTELMIKSHDINVIEFHIAFDGLELTADHTVKVLSVFNDTKSQTNVNCEIVDGKAIYRPDTSIISQYEYVQNYVYVYHGNQSLDVRLFTYIVDSSEIDKTAIKVKTVYDQSYAELLTEFEARLQDYKDSLPQASDLRAEIDLILNQFGVDSQDAISYLGEVSEAVEIAEQARKDAELLRQESYEQKVDTAIVEADVVSKVDSKVTELTPQISNLTAQLAQTMQEASRKRELEDLSPTVLAAIEGGEGTSFNLLSIPQNDSVTSERLSPKLRETLNIEKSWNLYNKENAMDGMVASNTPTAIVSAFANAIYSGLTPVEVGKTYIISQKLKAIGEIFCYDETVNPPSFNTGGVCAINAIGGTHGSWVSPEGKITRENIPLTDGFYVTKITILDPAIKFIAWHMHSSSYWTHTTEQFNELINSAQVEEGTMRTSYTDYGWENYKINGNALPEEFQKLQNDDVVVLKQNADISVRVHFDDTKDLFHLWQYPRTDFNKGLNLSGIYTCDKTAPYDKITGDLYKNSGDDIAPLFLNGSYVGANHGFLDSNKLTVNNHGKTIKDIGSVWLLSGGVKQFIILDIVDSNTLKVFSDFTGNQKSPTHYWSPPTGTLTHISGATNTSDIVITASVKEQLYPNTNRKSLKLVLDNKEITDDGVYYGDKFDLIEVYNITDIPSIQQYLKNRVGSSTKPNLEDDAIGGWVTVTNVFTHNKNGSITIKTAYEFLKDTNISFYGVTQSMTIGDKAYVPDVGLVDGKDLSTVVTQGTNALEFTNATWLSPDKPPYRYHQFNDDLSKGMALGYNPLYGVAKPEIRKNDTSAGNYNGSSKKMYPHVKVGGSATSGDYHEIIAYRIPLRSIDTDATCLYWYWVGEDIYLAFDYHKNINKIIELPSYMVGKKIEQLDIHANTIVQSEFVSAKGIKVKVSNNYGYGVLKLYD